MNDAYRQEMRRLKADLVLRGITQTEVARRLGITPQSVNQVLNGRRRNARVVECVRDLLREAA